MWPQWYAVRGAYMSDPASYMQGEQGQCVTSGTSVKHDKSNERAGENRALMIRVAKNSLLVRIERTPGYMNGDANATFLLPVLVASSCMMRLANYK